MKRSLFLLVLAASSHFFAFSDASWMQSETQNFTFIYQERDSGAVIELLTYAEEIYSELTNLLGTTTPRVTVVLYGDTDFANGYYNPNPPQHIGLYTVQPSGPWIGAGTESWLRFLFVHELTHFIQANHRPSLFYGLGSIFGRSISGLDIGFVPLWVTEGMAIHTESLLTGGGRQSDPLFELYYKALAIEDDLFSLRQAGYSSHLAPQGGRPYVAGAFVWEELEARYGPEFAARFLNSYTPFPLFGMWRVIRATTDSRMTTIYESITNELIREYAAQARQPVDERVSPDVEANYALPAATDDGLITYRVRPDERSGFVLLKGSQAPEETLLAAPAADRDAWDASADGSTIVFATATAESRSGLGSDVRSDLYRFDRATGTTVRLTNGGGYYSPAVDGDGRYIVAAQRSGNYQRLVSFDSQSEAAESRVLLDAPRSRFYYPDVSPDGSLALAALNQEGLQQIVLLTGPSDPSPGEVIGYVPLIDGAAPYKPLFEDSSAVTFSAYVDGALSLFRYDLDTASMTRIATDRVGVVGGFSDGGRIVYQAYTSDGFVVRQGPIESVEIAPERLSQLSFRLDPAEERTAEPPESKPYRAIPTPRFWLPWFTIREPADREVVLGVGALVSGADYLGRNAWQSELYYFPDFKRSGYGFAYNWQAGRYGLQLAFGEEYLGNVGSEAAPVYLQRFDNALRFQVDLVSRYELGISNRLTLGLELNHLADVVAPAPFQLYEAAGEATQLAGGLLAPGVTLSFARARQKPRNAAVPPGGVGISGQALSPFSLPEFVDQDLLLGVAGYYNIPIAGSHVVRVAPSTRFSTSAVFRTPFSLRGFGGGVSASDTSTAFYHLSADYLAPRILVDLPLLSSVGVTEIGFGAFAETAGDIVATPTPLVPASTFVLGLESTIVITYLLEWPVTLGVAFRVNSEDPAGFSADDVSFYLDIDLNESIGTIGDYLER